jgi:hypothetical protein
VLNPQVTEKYSCFYEREKSVCGVETVTKKKKRNFSVTKRIKGEYDV